MVTKETVAADAVEIASDVKDLAVDATALTVEQTERVVTVVKNNLALTIGVGVAGLAVGAMAGWKYAERKLTLAFEEELEVQIAAVKRTERVKETVRKDAEVARRVRETVKTNPDILREKLNEMGYVSDAVLDETIAPVLVNGEPMVEDFDYDAELALRSPDQPYVISHDEFLEANPEYTQVTVVYYAGDNTLADEREQPVEDLNYTVGANNLLRFGHGSRDSNVVYVRNEKLEMDFEIQRSLGSFATEVMGYQNGDG